MSAELYYLVGKPNSLKQALVSELRNTLAEKTDILVPEVYTTDEVQAESENYIHIDERNFLLRESMDVYCMSWEKNGHYYGFSGDLIQRLNSGVDIILNGSFHSLDQAKKQFPGINTVMIKRQNKVSSDNENYLIAEDDEVRLEWDSQDAKFGHPYVLTLMSDDGMQNALDMLSTLITYNRNCLQYVV